MQHCPIVHKVDLTTLYFRINSLFFHRFHFPSCKLRFYALISLAYSKTHKRTQDISYKKLFHFFAKQPRLLISFSVECVVCMDGLFTALFSLIKVLLFVCQAAVELARIRKKEADEEEERKKLEGTKVGMEIIRVAVLHTLRSFHFLLNPTRATRHGSNIQGLSLRLKIFFLLY